MFSKVFVLLASASLACAGYLDEYSGDHGIDYGTTKAHTVGAVKQDSNLKGWNQYNEYTNGRVDVQYLSRSGKDSKGNQWVQNRNCDSSRSGRHGYGDYGYGAATSYANSNLQSYGAYAYGTGGKFNRNMNYYNYYSTSYPKYGSNYGLNDLRASNKKYLEEQKVLDRAWESYDLEGSDSTNRDVGHTANDWNNFNTVVRANGMANQSH